MTVFYRQFWNDQRLRFVTEDDDIIKNGVSFNHHLTKLIWIPEPYFLKSKHIYHHSVSQPNTLIRLFPDGNLTLSSRITIVSKCYMDLRWFPQDIHECHLQISSFQYSINDIIYRFKSMKKTDARDFCNSNDEECGVVIAHNAIRLVQFQLLDWHYHDAVAVNPVLNQNHSILRIEFRLRRHLGYYVVQTYFPSIRICQQKSCIFKFTLNNKKQFHRF